eukprot:52147_1
MHYIDNCDPDSKQFESAGRNNIVSCPSNVPYELFTYYDEGDYNGNTGAAPVVTTNKNTYYKPPGIGGLEDSLTSKTLRLKMGPNSSTSNASLSSTRNYSFCSESSDASTTSFGSIHLQSLKQRSRTDTPAQLQRSHTDSPVQLQHTANNLIVFDWDNTLFPTKYIREMGVSSKRHRIKCNRNRNHRANASKVGPIACSISIAKLHKRILNSKGHEPLCSLSDLVYQVLSSYIERYGANNIHIVTASEPGWIQSSLFMVANIGSFKKIYNLIFIENKIGITHPFPSQLPLTTRQHLLEFKYRVFCELLKVRNLSRNTVNTFISIGDGAYEFEAAKLAAATCPTRLYVDRIKLIPNPSLQDMKDEMGLLMTFCGIFEYTSRVDQKNITIDYERERKQHVLHTK